MPKDLVHEPCAGSVAFASEVYTPFMGKKVLDGLLAPADCCKPSHVGSAEKALGSLPPWVPASHAHSGTLLNDTVYGVCGPAVSSNLELPLDLSYAGDPCACTEADAKALSATAQAEGNHDHHRPRDSMAGATCLGLVTKTVPPHLPPNSTRPRAEPLSIKRWGVASANGLGRIYC